MKPQRETSRKTLTRKRTMKTKVRTMITRKKKTMKKKTRTMMEPKTTATTRTTKKRNYEILLIYELSIQTYF
jgi:hypothetical protein